MNYKDFSYRLTLTIRGNDANNFPDLLEKIVAKLRDGNVSGFGIINSEHFVYEIEFDHNKEIPKIACEECGGIYGHSPHCEKETDHAET